MNLQTAHANYIYYCNTDEPKERKIRWNFTRKLLDNLRKLRITYMNLFNFALRNLFFYSVLNKN
jgi:hypothetical protein